MDTLKKLVAIVEQSSVESPKFLQALRELQLLSTASAKKNREPMAAAGVVPPLLRCIRRCASSETVASSAMAVLWNLAASSANQSLMYREGCVAVLLEAGLSCWRVLDHEAIMQSWVRGAAAAYEVGYCRVPGFLNGSLRGRGLRTAVGVDR